MGIVHSRIVSAKGDQKLKPSPSLLNELYKEGQLSAYIFLCHQGNHMRKINPKLPADQIATRPSQFRCVRPSVVSLASTSAQGTPTEYSSIMGIIAATRLLSVRGSNPSTGAVFDYPCSCTLFENKESGVSCIVYNRLYMQRVGPDLAGDYGVNPFGVASSVVHNP